MREQRQGFMKLHNWVLDELNGDCKALGLYAYLLNRQCAKREAFEYKVNDRTYKVLAGQHMTSYRRLMKKFGLNLNTTKKLLKKLEEINAIKLEMMTVITKTAKPKSHIDGILITFLTPFTFVNTPYDEKKHPPITNVNDTPFQTESLIKNPLEYKNYNSKKSAPCAHARINNKSLSDRLKDEPEEISRRDSSKDRKNIPPTSLDDPMEHRFNLDQKYDPRVRESVWRQLAVDWYFWATDNGKWRALSFQRFTLAVKEMVLQGYDENLLKEMFEKVVMTNDFWRRNFKRIDEWDKTFSNGERKIDACLNDLKKISQKTSSNHKRYVYDEPLTEDDLWLKNLGNLE